MIEDLLFPTDNQFPDQKCFLDHDRAPCYRTDPIKKIGFEELIQRRGNSPDLSLIENLPFQTDGKQMSANFYKGLPGLDFA